MSDTCILFERVRFAPGPLKTDSGGACALDPLSNNMLAWQTGEING